MRLREILLSAEVGVWHAASAQKVVLLLYHHFCGQVPPTPPPRPNYSSTLFPFSVLSRWRLDTLLQTPAE